MSSSRPPAPFVEALESLRALRVPSRVRCEEIEAPTSLAPYAAALSFRALCSEETPATAFFVVLYDPETQPGWRGCFRLIAHMHTEVEEELGNDPMALEVAWSWLHSALQRCGAGYHSTAGTATCSRSAAFGDLRASGTRTELDVRASWSPTTTDLLPHAQAVAHLIAFVSGHLDPLEALGA